MLTRNALPAIGARRRRCGARRSTPGRQFLALLALLALPALAGCGGGGDGNAQRLTVWVQKDPKEMDLFRAHAASFESAHPGVEIETVQYETETLRTQFQTAALAGGGPDLVYGPSDQVGPFTIMELIQPLDGWLDPALLGAFLPTAFDTLDGHLYALPDQIGNHLALVYNRALVPEPPADTDALVALGRRLTADLDGDGRPDRYGLAMNLLEPFWLVPWLGGFGGWVMDAEHEPTLDTPAMIGALTFLRGLEDSERIMPPESSYELMDTMFKEGRVGMIVNGPWSWQSYIDAGVDLGIAPLPVISATGGWPAPMVATKGYSLNRNAPAARLPLVRELIEYLTGESVQTDLVRKMRILPSRRAVYEREVTDDEPILAASGAQLRHGRRMPVVVEMRAIWDSMRPELQNCMNGVKTPADAARDMQAAALNNIRSLRGERR